jgi:hypothetical protein
MNNNAVRTQTGTKVHVAAQGGSSTNCGLRVKRLTVVDLSKVANENRCDKCYGWNQVKPA